ncbi:AMP-binding protein [Moorena producens]|uniref:AMP-binding protein n=1 Tax=Moorena producens TaxID=1155739 RepID=UPI003C71ADFA
MKDSLDQMSENIPKFSTLVDLLRYRAIHQPDQIIYTFLLNGETPDRYLTHQQLDNQAQAIASELLHQNAKGERALLLYPPGLEFITAFFGCLYAGVLAVPAYPPRSNQNLSRLEAIVADAQAKFALTTTPLLEKIETQLADNPASAVARGPRANKQLKWLATDKTRGVGIPPHKQPTNHESDWQHPDCNEKTLAFLQYTSGSTGKPKGVMVSHGNLLYNSALINQCFQDTPESRGLSWLPAYHDMGLIGGILQPLYVGLPIILMAPVDFLRKPYRWLKAISQYQVTTSGAPNFAYELCVQKITAKQLETLDLSSWQMAFTGAEPVRASTLERFAQKFAPCGFRREAFYPCYGMAETTLLVTGGLKDQPPVIREFEGEALEQNLVVPVPENRPNQSNGNKSNGNGQTRMLVGCGRTWLNEKIAIAHPQSLTQVEAGAVGEIWVKGPSVAQGYWNQPEVTEKTFNAYLADTDSGPWLRTGDLGFIQDGELFVTGRLKDLIIIRGRNHYPQDIELTAEKSHPALRPAYGAAFSVEVEQAEQLVIVQEVSRNYLRKLDVDEVVEAIRSAVSQEYQLQVYAVLLLKTNSIPKTSSGKVQRHACRAGFLNNSLTVVGQSSLAQHPTIAPTKPEKEPTTNTIGLQQTRHTLQKWIVNWLARETKLPAGSINISKSFADYGLDSVTAVELADDLEEWLGVPLSPTLAYDYPNIESLAQYLATQSQKSNSNQGDSPRKIEPRVSSAGTEMQQLWEAQFQNLDQFTSKPFYRSPVTVQSIASSGDQEVDQLLAELEMLSEAQIQEILGKPIK